MLLWLWCKTAAVALIQPLIWELAYAAGAILKKKRKKKEKEMVLHRKGVRNWDVQLNSKNVQKNTGSVLQK